jgi:hypothetical protein
MRRKLVNFIFGIIVGVFITLFACNPSMLSNAFHWAGDKVVSEEAIELQQDLVGPPSVSGK